MALPVFLTIAFILAHMVFYLKKTVSFLNNSILFMIVAIISKNYLTIMTIQLELLKTTEKTSLFIVLLLNREIIIPLLVVFFINVYFQLSTWISKTLFFTSIVVFMQTMDVLLVHPFKVMTHIDWNLYYTLFVNILYILLGVVISKLLNIIPDAERVAE